MGSTDQRVETRKRYIGRTTYKNLNYGLGVYYHTHVMVTCDSSVHHAACKVSVSAPPHLACPHTQDDIHSIKLHVQILSQQTRSHSA